MTTAEIRLAEAATAIRAAGRIAEAAESFRSGPGRPVVLLEGPDGGGKTTLADALVSSGWAYEHCGPPEKPAVRYYLDAINRHPGVPTVVDRGHPGSYVYGKAFRGMDDLTDHERWVLDGTIESRHGVVIYCRPPFEQTQKNLERGPDNPDAAIYEDPAKRGEVRKLYDDYFTAVNGMTAFRYDYTAEGAFDHTVHQLAALAFLSVPTPADAIPALGNTRSPKFVLVGDEPSGHTKIMARIRKNGYDRARGTRYLELASAPWLWEPPFLSQSGRYLHMAITISRRPLQDYCVVDSVQFDGRGLEALDEGSPWWPHWLEAEWVALGQAAHRRLQERGLPHRTVPHPSWWMRNAYKDVRGYARGLFG